MKNIKRKSGFSSAILIALLIAVVIIFVLFVKISFAGDKPDLNGNASTNFTIQLFVCLIFNYCKIFIKQL